MPSPNEVLTIGDVVERSGVSASTLRFYESKQLIFSSRTLGNQRRYHRSQLRRIAVIRVAQTLGLTLEEISEALSQLPKGRTPTMRDWEQLSTRWRKQLDERIRQLEAMREKLTGCIGCGCLSLKRCTLYNAGDMASSMGSGPRYLMGDEPTPAKPKRKSTRRAHKCTCRDSGMAEWQSGYAAACKAVDAGSIS